MSPDDFLRDSIAAARQRADEGADDGAATRLRIRESLANPRRAPRKRFTLIAAVIASLVGSTAFAYWSGWRPPWSKPAEHEPVAHVSMQLPDSKPSKSLSSPVPTPVVEVPPEPTTVAKVPAPKSVTPSTVVEVPTPKSSPVVEVPTPKPRTAVDVQTPKPTTAVDVRTPKPSPQTSNQVASVSTENPTEARVVVVPAPDPELAAYGRAHNLHFRGGDPKAALAAWDAYLAAYPNGKLAIDARYDRALVLVKLERWADARAALAPFATAAAGSYRQREAAEILAAIRDR